MQATEHLPASSQDSRWETHQWCDNRQTGKFIAYFDSCKRN